MATQQRQGSTDTPVSGVPLARVRDIALITMGIALTVLAVLVVILLLTIWPRVNSITRNLDTASTSAVRTMENVETVSSDLAAVSTSLRQAAGRIAGTAEKIEQLSGRVDQGVELIKTRYQELDLTFADVAAGSTAMKELLAELKAQLATLEVPEVPDRIKPGG